MPPRQTADTLGRVISTRTEIRAVGIMQAALFFCAEPQNIAIPGTDPPRDTTLAQAGDFEERIAGELGETWRCPARFRSSAGIQTEKRSISRRKV